MPFPWAAAAPIIGGALGAAGGLLGGHLDRKAARDAARNSIQWRVQDALAAGVHPLFALGYQGSFAPSPGFTPSYADAGEKIGNAVSATLDPSQRSLTMAQISAIGAASKKDFSESAYWDAQTAKLRQEMEHSAPKPPSDAVVDPISGALVRPYGSAEITAEQIPVRNFRGMREGGYVEYGWKTYDFGDGPVTLFRGDPDQLMSDLQDMDVATRLAIVAENEKRGQSAALAKLLDIGVGGRRSVGQRYKEQYGARPKGERSYRGYPYGR